MTSEELNHKNKELNERILKLKYKSKDFASNLIEITNIIENYFSNLPTYSNIISNLESLNSSSNKISFSTIKKNIENNIQILTIEKSNEITLKLYDKIESVKLKNENFNEIFIVHGHDDRLKNEVSDFIKNINLKPIILHEQPNSGKTIIEKIEKFTNVGFAIVLYTPCDVGSKNSNNIELRYRARQNVVFEHGYLISKIGRKNVCPLVKGEIEIPNDISGMVYVSEKGNWKEDLIKELKESGYKINH